jgi:hypothetical protein
MLRSDGIPREADDDAGRVGAGIPAAVSSRRSVTAYWDAHVNAWLAGGDPLRQPLDRWFASYAGGGAGAVTRDGLVEPYQGDLLGLETEPRAVVLGLNPGRYIPEFQSRTGTFAREVRALGSYSGWIRTYPYDRDPWLATMDRTGTTAHVSSSSVDGLATGQPITTPC